jgi:3-methyladenine DNA glycosylase AlkD
MPGRAKRTSVDSAVAALKRLATTAYRDGLARYAIPADNAFGVPVGKIRDLGKSLGRDHALAAGLWVTGLYEPRLFACFVADPGELTAAVMDRWCKDFDSWAICDTACFHLFDRSPHAWKKVAAWSRRKPEFEKRAAFALLASLALHDKTCADEPFGKGLLLIERESTDPRNFVKKGLNWALRAIGGRNAALRAAAVELAKKLAASPDSTARWNGKDALRQLAKRAGK